MKSNDCKFRETRQKCNYSTSTGSWSESVSLKQLLLSVLLPFN